jgi:hypothetical protein|tara:strand:+ start:9344 stop:9796 length:453 start_codon:yes stop_codon:yes gene_type:complete
MWLDETNEFADATSVGTPNNTTVNVGDIIDLTTARDIGIGEKVAVVVQVTTAITSGGAATVAFLIVSDATTTIATDGTATKHVESDAIAVASLVAGYQMAFYLPAEDPDYERYLAFQVKETAGQALTAGNVNAFITKDIASWSSYADANN